LGYAPEPFCVFESEKISPANRLQKYIIVLTAFLCYSFTPIEFGEKLFKLL